MDSHHGNSTGNRVLILQAILDPPGTVVVSSLAKLHQSWLCEDGTKANLKKKTGSLDQLIAGSLQTIARESLSQRIKTRTNETHAEREEA